MFVRLYNAALWGMFLAVLLSRNTWLEMRVNLGWGFFALALLLLALQSRLNVPARPAACIKSATFRSATFSLAAAVAGCWLLLGSGGITIIPAALLREGLGMPGLSLRSLNFAIAAFLAVGWIVAVWPVFPKTKR